MISSTGGLKTGSVPREEPGGWPRAQGVRSATGSEK